MPRIHPTAVVDPAAKLADDVEVGPLAYVGPGVELGPGVVVANHASIALQKGQQGERIDVKNISSGRTVQAVILDGGTVQVPL